MDRCTTVERRNGLRYRHGHQAEPAAVTTCLTRCRPLPWRLNRNIADQAVQQAPASFRKMRQRYGEVDARDGGTFTCR
jgi:hypothetical protein